ncbi:ubiquinone biosynthesis protein [Desulfotomaculum arcticum]|uniref:Ubiquinone biosynthesis protein n=1 Tax=Desulfotruncus arcticus DSM 17038 TaxID=1121424 RepID=A0A1I2V765_9FIRM|nr:AarF/UbiB family protein [Desulfotruncus arcticus]SFG84037.1 ubiquinone biosynthesis protein [Desulfotomaculum arcticum] [Desulfotruncus arcticus DSM 17038]
MFKSGKITNIVRGKEILTILIRYGFQDLLDKLSIDTGLLSKNIIKIERGLSTPVKVRKVLEELGPTFIKFGQLVSMRPDLIPDEYIRELEKLQDEVPIEEIETIVKIIENELGMSTAELFADFDHRPIAAGSLSQVHRAVLGETGELVAVKVRRPRIGERINTDLAILEWFAEAAQKNFDELKNYNLPEFVEELRRTIMRELDFEREARNMAEFRRFMLGNDTITSPRVFMRYTTKRVLTMELVEGRKPNRLKADAQLRRKLAGVMLNAYTEMVFERGFFHADPHAGNVLVVNGKLYLLDWGMTGRLTRNMRLMLLMVLVAVLESNEERVVKLAIKAFGVTGVNNRELLARDVLELIEEFNGRTSANKSIGQLLINLVTLFRQYQIVIPPQYVLVSRALLIAEGLSRMLHPGIDVVAVIGPYVKKQYYKLINPASNSFWLEEVQDLILLGHDAPEKVGKLLDMLAGGEFKLEHKGLSHLKNTLLEASNKLTLAIITGALIVGSSLVITSSTPPLVLGHSAIGVAGYLFSSVLGIVLVFNILRGKG